MAMKIIMIISHKIKILITIIIDIIIIMKQWLKITKL